MRKVILITVVAMLPLMAQPVYTADDFPEIGYMASFDAEKGDITVDVGTTGGPQSWDFTGVTATLEATFEVLDLEGTPAGDSFAGVADFCYHFDNIPVPGQDNSFVEYWQYLKMTASEVLQVGNYEILTDTLTLEAYHDFEPDRVNSTIPLQVGSTWIDESYVKDTLDENGLITLDRWESSVVEVDAWGTVTVPKGTFEALRFISYDTTIVKFNFIVPGEPDTVRTIRYWWVSADMGPIVILSSKEDETNPEFTSASIFLAMTENNLPDDAIGEVNPIRNLKAEIDENRLLFSTPQPGYVRIEIFDALGRKEALLLDAYLSSGKHQALLPDDLSSGVHFISISGQGLLSRIKFIEIN